MNHGKMRTGVVTCQTGGHMSNGGGHMSNGWSHVKRVVTCQTGGHMSNGWSHVKRVVTCQTGGHMSKNAETYMLCLFASRVNGPPFRVRSLLRSHRRLRHPPCWSLLRSHSFWREVVDRAGR